MKLTKNQIRMLAQELVIDEFADNDEWKEMVKQIQQIASGATMKTLVGRFIFTDLNEQFYQIPSGATHYAMRRFDGPAIDFWRIEE